MLNEEELLKRVNEIYRLADQLKLINSHLNAKMYAKTDIRTTAMELLRNATMEELDKKLAP